MLKIIIVLILVLFVLPRPVHAYIDPGTGSYLFQFVIAGALGSLFFFRGHLDKIRSKFKKNNTLEINKKANEKSEKNTDSKK